MTQDIRLYQSAEIWDQPMQSGQRNLLTALLDFWPTSPTNALDVGCGDGKLSAIIAQVTGTSFTGIDSSVEALSRLPYPGVLGDATSLPFDDDAFDAVITTDALEHMPDHEEHIAWSELFRVARDWVMVAVPFREELLDATSICRSCQQPYHVNWHHRAYDIADLHRQAPPGWTASASVIAGEPWTQMLPMETRFRHGILGEAAGWENAMCPHCGAPGHIGQTPEPLDSLTAAALGQAVYKDLAEGRYWRSHSEVLVIFSRELALNIEVPRALAKSQPAGEFLPTNPPVRDLLPYPQVSQYVETGDSTWRIQLPLYIDLPQLQVRRIAGSTEPLKLMIEDALGVLFDGTALLHDQNETTLQFGRDVVPGYYGVLVTVAAGAPLHCMSLGASPEILRLEVPGQTKVAYQVDQFAGAPLYIQVVEPSWVDPKTYNDWRVPGDLTLANILDLMETRFRALQRHLASVSQSAEIESSEQSTKRVEQLTVAVQNLELERDALQKRAREADAIAVELQNLTAERDGLLVKARAIDAQAVDLQNLTAERDALLAKARASDAQAVQLQNLTAERDALLAKAYASDAQAVQLQNLTSERDALLAKARASDTQAVQLQNLTAERDALLEKAHASNAQAVQLQNLIAERDALLVKARTSDVQAVALENLTDERDALLARAKEADQMAVDLQNLKAERDALARIAADANRIEVLNQNLNDELLVLRQRAEEAETVKVQLQNLEANHEALLVKVLDVDRLAIAIQNVEAENELQRMHLREASDQAIALQALVANHQQILEELEHMKERAQQSDKLAEERDALKRRYHQLEAEAKEQMAQLVRLNTNIENRLGSFARRHLGKIRHRVSTGEN